MDGEGSEQEIGLTRRRLSPWIALLFLVVAVIVLGRLVTSYIGVTQPPGQNTPDLQPRLDQASTAQAQFVTESASIYITETAAAAIATARPFTQTAYAPTVGALQTAYIATQTAYVPTYEALQTAYAPTYEAYQTAYMLSQTAYAPTGKAFLTAYIPTQTAFAPTLEAFQTVYPATQEAFLTAYASTAIAMGTMIVYNPVPKFELASGSSGRSLEGLDAADVVRWEAGNLDKGRYLFNAPSEMIAGNKYRVELRIVRDTQVDNDLMSRQDQELFTDLLSQGTPQVKRMQVENLMKAKLTASDFAITPLNEEEQVILGQSYTQWAWDVTPRRAGDLDLNLTISMKVIFRGAEGAYDHPVITKKIFVRVNPAYSFQAFAGDNWQWLVGTFVLPVLAWLWKKMRDQETGKKKKPSSTKKTKKQASD